MLAALGAFLLCVAFSPDVSSVTFTPKYLAMLLFAGAGVLPIMRLARQSAVKWAARSAIAFLAVGLVSALVSVAPGIGIFGLFDWGTGWLLWLGAAGAFAIGATLRGADRDWLFRALIAGAVVNAIVAIWQVTTVATAAGIGLYGGTQADGLLGNPIHLESLLLGSTALILGRACRAPLRWGSLVVLFSVALEFSAERLALPVLAALCLYAVYSYGIRRGGTFSAMVAGGLAIGYLGGGSGLAGRVTGGSSESTYGLRLHIWDTGLHYVLHHPLIGAGPGELRSALDSVGSLSFAQQLLPNSAVTDGHDMFVEVVVTTGILGLVCFLGWLGSALRQCPRSGLLGFAAAIAVVTLVEPLNIATLPLMFLALGAATCTSPRADGAASGLTESSLEETSPVRQSPLGVVIATVALCAALALGGSMVAGDWAIFSATHYELGAPYNLARAKLADRLLPYWPESAESVSQVLAFQSLAGGVPDLRVIASSRRFIVEAIGRDPADPNLWAELGNVDRQLGATGQAGVDYMNGYEQYKWSVPALQGLGVVAATEQRWSDAIRWYRLALLASVRSPGLTNQLSHLLATAEAGLRA